MVTTQVPQNPLRATKSGFYGLRGGCNCGGSGMAAISRSPVLAGLGALSGGLAAAATDEAMTNGAGAGAYMGNGGGVVAWAKENPAWAAAYGLTGTIGMVAGVYHGYARNDSVGWALWWGLMGAWFPFSTVPIAIAQGFGEPG